MIKTLSLLLLLAFSLLPLGCQPADTEDERSITVNGVDFAIPKQFFHELGIPADNSSEATVLLVAELPDITLLTKPDVADFFKEQKLRYTRVKISSPFNKDGTKRLALSDRLKQFSVDYRTTEKSYSKYGLQHLVRPANVKMDRPELLYEGNEHNPTTFLMCDELPGYGRYPGCEMQFYFQGLVVEVDFRRKEWLSDWKMIKRNTLYRLEEFHNAYKFQQKGE